MAPVVMARKRAPLRSAALTLTVVAVLLALGMPRLLPTAARQLAPEIMFRGDAEQKVLYLTIDDAPTTATSEILEVLRRHQVQATFFIMSARVTDPGQLRAIVADGHALGHHLRTGQAGAKLRFDQFRKDFDSTEALLRQFDEVQLYRPPSGSVTAEQLRYASRKGYTTVLGTIYPFDHWLQSPRALRWLCSYLAVPGGIVILHDGVQRGRITAELLEALIPRLRANGYEFELLNPTRAEFVSWSAEAGSRSGGPN